MIAATGFDDDERGRDAARKRRGRSSARDIEIPECFDPIRRRDCLADPYLFLPTYLAEKFPRRWTADRRRIVDEIMYRAEYGGQKALAAPRGKGKTSIAEGVVGIFAILKGLLRFPLIVGATGADSARILANIKAEFERNPILALDFPEVCIPILAMEGWSSRARMQTVGGARTHMVWCNDHVVFPTVAGSPASGAILATRSIDGAIRGLRVGNQRPDYVLIDDPETRDSARSQTECEKREKTIDNDIGGLGGGGKQVSTLILSTCQSCTSLSFRYTDPRQKPAYSGERMKAVEAWPENADLWNKYVEQRREDMQTIDEETGKHDIEARRANQFYLDNRQAMDAGAVLSDEDWFDATELPDGSPREVSALQHIYNIVADKDWTYVLTELQNDPPTGEEDAGVKLTEYIVRGSAQGYDGRMNGCQKGTLPPAAGRPVAFIDVGENFLTWEVMVELGSDRPNVIDYGKTKTDSKSVVGVKHAIRKGLDDVRDYFKAQNYDLTCGLIDSGSGLHTETIYRWVKDNAGPWYPSKGDGKYTPPKPAKHEDGKKNQARHWNFSSVKNCPRQLVLMDSDYWKQAAHAGFLMSPLNKDGEQAVGSCRLFGVDPHGHSEFAREIVAEELVKEFTETKGFKIHWVQHSRGNHYLDTHYGCLVALAVAKHLARPQSMIVGPRVGSGFVRSTGGSWFRAK